ncbi:MAG: cation-translocating P-type ATPase, partial [Sandaracinaceae bacterium]|nr:cation-translocating P-type ATPase [Sandaracinaceae bacterium]
VFANLRKFTTYVLASNGPEIAPFLLYVVLPVPLALTIVQILWIDLGTDIVPSMALGQEPPDPDVMERPPRKRSESLLSPRLLLHAYGFLGGIEALYSLALFFYVLHLGGWRWGVALAHDDPLYLSATGITLATVMIMQVGNYVGCRSSVRSGLDRGLFSNRLALIGFAIEIALSFMLLYVPEVASLLGAGPVPAHVYALAWLGAPLIFVLAYLRKRRARLPASPS